MKFDVSGVVALLIDQVASLTRDEQRTFAHNLGAAVATLVKSSKTRIDDAAMKSIALPIARDFLDGVGTNL